MLRAHVQNSSYSRDCATLGTCTCFSFALCTVTTNLSQDRTTRMDERKIPELSIDEFCDLLSTTFHEDLIESFLKNKVSGKCFMKLTEQ